MNNYRLKLGQSLTGLLVITGLFGGLAIESKKPILAATLLSENPTTTASQIDLEGTSWILQEWRDENNSKSLETTEPITANFVNGQVKGSASCNRYIASYKIEGNQLQITPAATTRKTCMGEIMEREFAYLAALEGVQRYEINDRGLEISYTTEEGSGIMTFVPQASGELENKTWVLVSLEDGTVSRVPLKGTEITVNFTEDQVRGFSSCNQYMTTYTKEGNKLSINALATTRKACPPEVMRQEFQYLTALEEAQWYEISPQGQLKISYKTQRGTGVMTFVPQENTTLTNTRMLTSWDDQQAPTNAD
ncbi:MAG: META domain-containing protein [Lyngbya sp.]|nr:META domain-containing protein [Lyngbya sp.]